MYPKYLFCSPLSPRNRRKGLNIPIQFLPILSFVFPRHALQIRPALFSCSVSSSLLFSSPFVLSCIISQSLPHLLPFFVFFFFSVCFMSLHRVRFAPVWLYRFDLPSPFHAPTPPQLQRAPQTPHLGSCPIGGCDIALLSAVSGLSSQAFSDLRSSHSPHHPPSGIDCLQKARCCCRDRSCCCCWCWYCCSCS